MDTAEITDFLSTCPSPESGCFASDPEALMDMQYMDDPVIRSDFYRAAGASTHAAAEGTPIEDVTYRPAILTAPDGGVFYGGAAKIGSSEVAVKVLDNADSEIARIRQRIVHCAYACGATAVGCPLRTAPDAREQ